MVEEKIRSVGLALGVLAGQVTEEQWQLIKIARAELSDAADTVGELEAMLQVPRTPRETVEAQQRDWADAGAARKAQRAPQAGVAHA